MSAQAPVGGPFNLPQLGGNYTWPPTVESLAVEIRALRDQLAQMKAHSDTWVWNRRDADYWEARARRAEADADRLAESIRWVADHPDGSAECPLCEVLDLHDREVEAR